MRYHVEHLACATTLRQLPRAFGEITDTVAARQAVEHRNRQVTSAFTTHLLPHTADLLCLARQGLDAMPPARHHTGWRLLLDDLDHATERIHHHLDGPANGTGYRVRMRAQLWPYLTTWAEHSLIVRDLIAQHRAAAVPVLPVAKREQLTALALEARERGELEPFESWFDAAGSLITLAYLTEHDDSSVVALAVDPTGDITALGRYENEYEAGWASPPPVPAGVLRPDAPWRSEQPQPDSEFGILIRDVITSAHTGDVSRSIAEVVNDGGQLPQLAGFLRVCAEFAGALDTVQGRMTGARLSVLAAQADALTREVAAAGEELGAQVAVLPPYRVPYPRHVAVPPGQALQTAAPPRASGNAPVAFARRK
ncbi:hypothetical protein [Actinacidiphila rubida]|uniref:Uncharacterized protein n=1 Tax=Actinacidiphila rubida TaxID=310780 RepID=A0A1H8S4J2_9ACTN|nr:hypothetical protein [Actinacidiphila rubida]SEO73611.1 hypothetical protein SAMN05216267_103936 [Actinacidiphila rubida]